MPWVDAFLLIDATINIGSNVNTPLSNNRIVTEIPPYPCYRRNFGGSKGFEVKIGIVNYIDIPWSMLFTLYQYSVHNNQNFYERFVFGQNYPTILANTGCYVHVVGKIFEISGVANYTNFGGYDIIV